MILPKVIYELILEFTIKPNKYYIDLYKKTNDLNDKNNMWYYLGMDYYKYKTIILNIGLYIIQKNYPKTHPIRIKIWRLNELICVEIASILDSLISNQYHYDYPNNCLDTIHICNTRSNRIYITSVFYHFEGYKEFLVPEYLGSKKKRPKYKYSRKNTIQQTKFIKIILYKLKLFLDDILYLDILDIYLLNIKKYLETCDNLINNLLKTI